MDGHDLSAAYARMAENEAREAEAQDWSDALITDVADAGSVDQENDADDIA